MLTLPLATSVVRAVWAPASTARAISILPSTAKEVYPPDGPIAVQLVDGSGGVLASDGVRCALAVAAARDASGARITATLIGSVSADTAAGVAVFTGTGLQAVSNASVDLVATCTWVSGDVVTTPTLLTLATSALLVLWMDAEGSSGRCACGMQQVPVVCSAPCAAAASAPINATIVRAASSLWALSGSGIDGAARNATRLRTSLTDVDGVEPALLPAALPSAIDVSTLQPLTPPPAIALVAVAAVGNASLLLSPTLVCTLAVDATFAAGTFTSSSLTLKTATDAVVTGTAAVATAAGQAAFTSVGLRGAGFGAAVPLSATCGWVTGEALVSGAAMARTTRLRVRLDVSPPAVALPSNPSVVYAWRPAPAVVIEHSAGVGPASLPYTSFVERPLTCTAAVASVSGAGVAASSVSLLGVTSVTTNTSDGTAVYTRLAAAAPLGSVFVLSFACPWISGDTPSVTAAPVNTPAISTAFSGGSTTLPSLQGPLTLVLPPEYVLYNTPLPPLGLQLSYTLANGTIGSSWAALTGAASAAELKCSLTAALSGTPVIVTGTTAASADSQGMTAFVNVALMPALPAAAIDPPQVATLTASCTAQGTAIEPPITAAVTVQRLVVSFLQAPPASALPSSPSAPQPFDPPVAVAVLNSTGKVLIEESTAACTVTVTSAEFSPAVPVPLQQLSLLGATRASVTAGVASFPGLAISGPLGSRATLTVACTRSAGGVVFPASATVVVDVLAATWKQPVPGHWWLYNTPLAAGLVLVRYTPDPAAGWTPVQGGTRPASGIKCSLVLTPTSTGASSSNGAAALRLSSPDFDNSGPSGSDGVVAFKPALAGAAGSGGNLTALCTIADQSFAPDQPLIVAVETVAVVAVVPPPSVWLPSYASAKTPFAPAPTILLRTTHGAEPVDAREAVCRVSVQPSSPACAILEPPLAGYTLDIALATLIDANGNTVSNETALSMAATTTPIRLPNSLVQAPMGTTCDMAIACTRSQGDGTAPYTWSLRAVDGDFDWLLAPPASIVSQRSFPVSLVLLDRGNGSSTVGMDDVTMCSLRITTNDTSILLQNNVAQAKGGVVTFTGVSLAARSGSTVAGRVSCALGQQAYPRELDWAITMAPCPRDTAPSGGGGYTCEQCGGGTYSDGGAGVVACTKCPRRGAECTGGALRLLPGFYRVPDGRDVIDERTELHECWNPRGCFVDVNESATNRSWAVTHRCERGYTGPLCGVCDLRARYARVAGACSECWPTSANAVVLTLLPLGIAAFVVWIAIYRKVKKSAPTQVLVRIILTYLSTLGTLGSLYAVRGTAAFRQLMGFSQAVGDSPMELSPVQCELGLSYYARFGITVGLPFIIAVLCLLVNVLYLTCRQVKAGLRGHSEGQAAGGIVGGGTMSRLAGAVGAEIGHFFSSQAWLAPVIFVLSATYSSLTSAAFSVFDCAATPVGGVRYLNQDLSVDCGSPTHTAFKGLAGFLIALFAVGFPLLFGFILRSIHARTPPGQTSILRRPEVFEKFGFLYDGYDIEGGMYWFESIVMMRRSGTVLLGAVVKDPWTQIVASVLLMTICLFLQANLQPYESRAFNLVEGVAIVGIVVTQLISMFYLRSENLAAACLGATSDTVVDIEGTTCAQVAATAANTDITVTFFLAAINVLLLAGMAAMMFNTWAGDQVAADPGSAVARALTSLGLGRWRIPGLGGEDVAMANGKLKGGVHQLGPSVRHSTHAPGTGSIQFGAVAGASSSDKLAPPALPLPSPKSPVGGDPTRATLFAMRKLVSTSAHTGFAVANPLLSTTSSSGSPGIGRLARAESGAAHVAAGGTGMGRAHYPPSTASGVDFRSPHLSALFGRPTRGQC